jgi:hypothetical protein
MTNPVQFYQLAPGARFEYQGKKYRKTAMDVAEEESGSGGPSRREWEVTPIRGPYSCRGV